MFLKVAHILESSNFLFQVGINVEYVAPAQAGPAPLNRIIIRVAQANQILERIPARPFIPSTVLNHVTRYSSGDGRRVTKDTNTYTIE